VWTLPKLSAAPSALAALWLCSPGEWTAYSLIKLLGRWRSDAMIHYFHIQCHSVMAGLSQLMLAGGKYRLLQEIATMPTQPNQHNYRYGLKMGAKTNIPVSDLV